MRRLGLLVAVALVAMTAVACSDNNEDQNRREAVKDREANFDRAEARWPVPESLVNFPIREALVKYTERQDLVNHPWYIYVLGMNGEYINYFVGSVYPVNACNFLSSTERFVDGVPVTAPSYDGIFYGGSGASGACDIYFTFDVVTDALYVFKAAYFYASDAPLNIDVPQVQAVQAPPAEVAP